MMDKIFVAPVKGYKPSGADDLFSVSGSSDSVYPNEGKMMDMTAKDRTQFPGWIAKYGGYHWDAKAGSFVHD